MKDNETIDDLQAAIQSLRTLNEAFRISVTASDQLDVMRHALQTARSILAHLSGAPLSVLALDELAFALEKLASKPDAKIEEIIARDTTSAQLRPSVELRANTLLAAEILYRCQPKGTFSRKAADAEAAKALSFLAGPKGRGAKSVEGWRTLMDEELRREFHALVSVANSDGRSLFGLSKGEAMRAVKELARSAQVLAQPDREPE